MAIELGPVDIKTFDLEKVKHVEKIEKLLQDCMKAKGVLPDNNLCASETYDKLKEFRELIIAVSKIQSIY